MRIFFDAYLFRFCCFFCNRRTKSGHTEKESHEKGVVFHEPYRPQKQSVVPRRQRPLSPFGSAVARLLPRLHGTCRRRLSAAHQRRMLRKNEKKKPSGALRHRLPHHNRCGIFIRPARKPRASSACVGLLRPAAQHHGPDLSAVFAHLVRFNDPRKRPVQALCCRLSAFPKETKSASVITDP